MNKEQEQGFFNQIEEVLQTHEETYELGAWEEFDANRKKNKRRWPIYWWAAAAVVLLFVGVGLFELAKTEALNNDFGIAKHNKKQESLDAIESINPAIRTPAVKTADPVTDEIIIVRSSEKVNKSNAAPIAPINVIEKPNQQSQNVAVAVVPSVGDKPIMQKTDRYSQVLPGAYDSLINRNRKEAVIAKKGNKLTYSLVVSPSLGNQKMNFGAGMELSYKLGNHLSINSGLMYAALNAKSEGKSRVATNTQSQGADLAISGIELPLGIQYQTKGGLYATAGISAVGLINDKLEYSFLEEKTVSFLGAAAGSSNEILKVVSERKTENSMEPLNNYMGFFNFSAGKKQAFGKTSLNIGPFVKVPFSSVSSEKIKLLQAGVKISFDF